MSEFVADIEQQYEVYCKIVEEYGFIDLNAKKNGFRCTTKSNEFNAGWIAFTGAVAAVRDEQQAKIDELQKENDKLNIWYKNVKLQLENKQIDCDRSDRETDELQKKYDAMYNAFIVADDCRKEWHESYMNVRLERDELQARIERGLKIAEDLMGELQNYKLGEYLENILKGKEDE